MTGAGIGSWSKPGSVQAGNTSNGYAVYSDLRLFTGFIIAALSDW